MLDPLDQRRRVLAGAQLTRHARQHVARLAGHGEGLGADLEQRACPGRLHQRDVLGALLAAAGIGQRGVGGLERVSGVGEGLVFYPVRVDGAAPAADPVGLAQLMFKAKSFAQVEKAIRTRARTWYLSGSAS